MPVSCVLTVQNFLLKTRRMKELVSRAKVGFPGSTPLDYNHGLFPEQFRKRGGGLLALEARGASPFQLRATQMKNYPRDVTT